MYSSCSPQATENCCDEDLAANIVTKKPRILAVNGQCPPEGGEIKAAQAVQPILSQRSASLVRPPPAKLLNDTVLKIRQRLGKYRIKSRLNEGAFGVVYVAADTIEGIDVALKIPHNIAGQDLLADFRNEVRLAAQLDHPNILPLKNAAFIDDRFVIAFALGERTLGERMMKRMSQATMLSYIEQMLEAVAHAHQNHIIHCDIKPENLILFTNNRLRLTDFGIARFAMRTVRGSGSGTVGYISPEQAMGQPSFRSDVFSLGLVMYKLLTGFLPEWPFDWPAAGHDRLRQRAHPDLIEIIRRSLAIRPEKRFRDAIAMRNEFLRIRERARGFKRKRGSSRSSESSVNWQSKMWNSFQKTFGRQLQSRYACGGCSGPVSEAMHFCPWCADHRDQHQGETRFPAHCPRCHRGMKLNWRYCPWCYGSGFEPLSERAYSDKQYVAKCDNTKCREKVLMPFMRYCPTCNRKVRRAWLIPGSKHRCVRCDWGIAAHWNHCAWCGKMQESKN
jgi:serine/threonine-protein kinase